MLTTVKARYDKGVVTWLEEPPVEHADIVVTFTFEKEAVTQAKENTAHKAMSTEEALQILSRFKGCIKSENFDYEQAKDEYFNEKYGSID